MKNFRRFMAVPVLALCALLTFSACSNDEPEGNGAPTISLQTPAVSRAGIAVPVSALNADNIHYAAMFKAADATTDPEPAPADFKTIKVSELSDGSLLIPATELGEQGTYVIYSYVTKGQVKSDTAKATVAFTEESFEELLKFEVKNITEFSLDVKVDMNDICDKYVVTVVNATVAGKTDDVREAFKINLISSGSLSINPTEDQLLNGKQAYKVFSKSAVIPESQLSKDTPYDTDVCEGIALTRLENDSDAVIEYVVAAYGIDKFGNESVYIGEPFTLPEATFTSDPVVEISPLTTLTKISANFKAPANCVKIVYGSVHTINNNPGGVSDINFWNDSNKDEIIKYLKKQPLSYSPIPNGTSVLDNFREMKVVGKPGEKLVVYAFGITADGKIGAMSYAVETLQLPQLNGVAKLQSLKIKPSEFQLKLFWDIVYSPNTTAVRFMMTTKEMYEDTFTGTPAKEAEFKWIMATNESPDGYGWWEEFSTDELRQMNYVYSPDVNWYNTEYVIYAVARDGGGKWGEIVKGPNQTTMKDPNEDVEEDDKSVDFTAGIGQASIIKIGEISTEDPNYGNPITYYDTTYRITKGANTVAVYQMWFMQKPGFGAYSDFTAEKLAEAVNSRTDKDGIDSTIKPALDTEAIKIGWEVPGYGCADFLVIFTKDTNGKYKIAAALTANHDPFIF